MCDKKTAEIKDKKLATSAFNLSSASKVVPKFQDSDLDSYFLAFEKTAGWTNELSALLIQISSCKYMLTHSPVGIKSQNSWWVVAAVID